jgi:NAD(P)-dependent dehydrogenase (short-subunit alcohol dehydrogenase family)
MARAGQRVFATMRAVNGKNKSIAAELKRAAIDEKLALDVVELDVTSGESIDKAITRAIDSAGHLDVVINNAGVMPVGVTEAFTAEQLRANLEVNVVGPFQIMREVLPHMRRRREGLIINVTTVLGRVTIPFYGVYQAAKWALEGLSETLRYELSGQGVDLVIVEPGPFATDLLANAPGPADKVRLAEQTELNAIFEGMAAAFTANVFENPDTPTDPEILVNALIDVIDTPAGKRPIRMVAGLDFGVGDVNRATDPMRLAALEALGLAHMEGVRSEVMG